MLTQPKIKLYVVTIGGILTIGGLLLLAANQLQVSFIPIGLSVSAALLGIIVLIIGKKLKIPSSSAERLKTLSLPQERATLGKPTTPARAEAPKTPKPLTAAARETHSNVAMLRVNLLVKCLNNEKQVERLIEYERRLSPRASEEQLVELAIERWERDNR